MLSFIVTFLFGALSGYTGVDLKAGQPAREFKSLCCRCVAQFLLLDTMEPVSLSALLRWANRSFMLA